MNPKPIRILHVLGALNRGGGETWLLHLLRHIDRRRFRIDFLVHTMEPAAYDEEVLALGSTIHRCPYTRDPIRYGRRFLEIIRTCGPFDVLHSHVHCFSAFTLSLGRLAGIPVRIAHSHNDTRGLPQAGHFRKLYEAISRRLIAAHCTVGVAASAPAAEDLFGESWQVDPRFRVLYCGVDFGAFQENADRRDVRAEFGFSDTDCVFGHVGRFDRQKNHPFLLALAAATVGEMPRAKFLLVGGGAQKEAMEERAQALGIRDKVVFAGVRSDAPRLMMYAMDALLLPSLHEGLPLVLMESQAAGLPSVVSTATPPEAVVNPTLVHRLPLAAGIDHWRRAACSAVSQPRFDRAQAVEIMSASPFSIDQSTKCLEQVYLKETAQASASRLCRSVQKRGNSSPS